MDTRRIGIFALLISMFLSCASMQMADASDIDQIRICMDQVKRWYEALSFDEFLNQVNDAYGSTYLWTLEDQSEYYRLLGSDAHQLPDENELSEEEACRSAAEI